MRVLLTGATGFVGNHLAPALEAAGSELVCGTRHPDAARARTPARRWVHLDVEREASVQRALVLTFTLDDPDAMTLFDLDADGAPRRS